MDGLNIIISVNFYYVMYFEQNFLLNLDNEDHEIWHIKYTWYTPKLVDTPHDGWMYEAQKHIADQYQKN